MLLFDFKTTKMSTTMISISPLCSSSASLPLQPRSGSALSTLRPLERRVINWKSLKKIEKQEISRRRKGRGVCRADLGVDAPFAAAIGACMLTSLVSPIPDGEDDDVSGGGVVGSTDTRYAAMGIISFIPYFNWMSWVFAWLDTGKQRYLVYAVVYLAPYLRTNLSLSPEESWLPIASILLCIIHIQLEASIRNGDLNDIQFFSKILNIFSPLMKKEGNHFRNNQEFPEGTDKEPMDLPFSQRKKVDHFVVGEAPQKHATDEEENKN